MSDLPTAGCAPARETLSAHLDGEDGPLPLAEARRHTDGCVPCERYGASLTAVTRRVRVAPADAVPDLTAPILAALADDRAAAPVRRLTDVRVLVGLAGAVQLLLALPVLLGVTAPALHLGRELGALELALGVGFLLAAYQPHRAAGVLPVAVAAVAVVAVGAAVDLLAGRAAVVAELGHLTELVGVAALWVLTRRLPDEPALRPATVV
jgi:predicted anti-sigma-YlaC factor YlaD